MPYVQRDESGKVKGVYRQPQEGYAKEFLSEDDPEVVAFLNPPPKTADEIAREAVEGNQVAQVLVEVFAEALATGEKPTARQASERAVEKLKARL